MNNNFKFRVWVNHYNELYPYFSDSEEQKMTNINAIVQIDEYGKPYVVCFEGDYDEIFEAYYPELYIGINDINNKSIYKGDIIKYIYNQRITNNEKYEEMLNNISLQKDFNKQADKTLFDWYDYCLKENTIEKEIIEYCEVCFDKGHFYLKKENNQWLFFDVIKNGKIEIVGNIHQNKDLLENNYANL